MNRWARLLEPATVRLSREQSFTAHPALSGWAHGFKERVLAGRRVLMHDGSWERFQSALVLEPEADAGVFVTTNGAGGIAALGELLPVLLEILLPPAQEPTAPIAAPGAAAAVGATAPVAGFYRATRSPRSTVEKVTALAESRRTSVASDGTLTFAGHAWTAIGQGVWERADGTERLASVAGVDGRTHYLDTDGPAYQRVAWYETPPVTAAVLLGFAAVALSALVGWPLTAGLRRLRGRPAPQQPAWRRARRLAASACAAGLGFLVLFALTLFGDTSEFLYGVPTRFRALMTVPVVFLVLLLAALVAGVRAVRTEPVGVAARAHLAVVAVGLAGLTWFLFHWNLVGWRFG